MTFNMIHPVVLEVYLRTLELDDYGDMLDGYWESEDEIPAEVQIRIKTASSMFTLAEKRALDILGSKEKLQEQLELFHGRRGSA